MELLPGFLPRLTTAALHTHHDSCHHRPANNNTIIGNDNDDDDNMVYLFAVRDPLQRLISWFTYERPRKKPPHERFFSGGATESGSGCGFQTVNQLGEAMAAIHDTTTTTTTATDNTTTASTTDLDCSRLAWRAVTGLEGFQYHNYYNYAHYWRIVNVNNSKNNNTLRIAVVRTEHLEHDWWSVERKIFGYEPTQAVLDQHPFDSNNSNSNDNDKHRQHRTNPSHKQLGDTQLSEMARKYLCVGLCRERAVYRIILERAENLEPSDVAESLRELAKSCPNNDNNDNGDDDCPDYTPWTGG